MSTQRAMAVVGGCILALGGVILWPHVHYGYDWNDTVNCLITTGGHQTRFAAGYSDAAFREVRVGMSRDEVFRALGEPLQRYAEWQPDFAWCYSAPASSSGHFHLREVRFTPEGKVSDVIKVFYFD